MQELLNELRGIAPTAPQEKLELLLSTAYAILSKESVSLGLPDFPIDNLPVAALILEQNPKLPVFDLLYRLYPYKSFLKDGIAHLESLLKSFKIPPEETAETPYAAVSKLKDVLSSKFSGPFFENSSYVETAYQNKLISEMLQTALASDFCLIGPTGCGKTISVTKVAEILERDVETIILYQDMTSRDLLQQRTTLVNGDTVWRFSPLVTAALEGKIAIIDGLHRIHPSTLSVLHRYTFSPSIIYTGISKLSF